jgi:hypothetical protein
MISAARSGIPDLPFWLIDALWMTGNDEARDRLSMRSSFVIATACCRKMFIRPAAPSGATFRKLIQWPG